jgi:hypothetical protein
VQRGSCCVIVLVIVRIVGVVVEGNYRLLRRDLDQFSPLPHYTAFYILPPLICHYSLSMLLTLLLLHNQHPDSSTNCPGPVLMASPEVR